MIIRVQFESYDGFPMSLVSFINLKIEVMGRSQLLHHQNFITFFCSYSHFLLILKYFHSDLTINLNTAGSELMLESAI